MPLDLGRARRHFNGPTRRALNLRDAGCAFPHCDRPTTMCDAHHVIPWYQGGRSDLCNAVLACARHHRLLHHSSWTVQINPRDGLPEFFAPGNPTPQRNLYHRRP
jgi:HNH endonuclease